MDFAKSLDSQQETIQRATNFHFSPYMRVHERDPHVLNHMLTQGTGERAFQQSSLNSSLSESSVSELNLHNRLNLPPFSDQFPKNENPLVVLNVPQQSNLEPRWQHAHPSLQPNNANIDPNSPAFDHTQLSRWMDRDSSTWVFISSPDMADDPEMKLLDPEIICDDCYKKTGLPDDR